MKRGLSRDFLCAMREKLEHGRQRGYVGWDKHWEQTPFPCDPINWMMMRLHQEVDELVIALHKRNLDKIRSEAADVANFAMFIADIEGALEEL